MMMWRASRIAKYIHALVCFGAIVFHWNENSISSDVDKPAVAHRPLIAINAAEIDPTLIGQTDRDPPQTRSTTDKATKNLIGLRDVLLARYFNRRIHWMPARSEDVLRPSIHVSSTFNASSANTRFARYPAAILPISCPIPKNLAG